MGLAGLVFAVALATSTTSFVRGDHDGTDHDHSHHNHEQHRVRVDVYYESLCPDSIKFFTTQLYPALQSNLSSFVNLTLLPYGKSTTTKDLNQYDFQCHHGPGECRGNRLQACALRVIDGGKKTDGLGFNNVTLSFINCLMGTVKRDGEKTEFPTQVCATQHYVQNYREIENCANDVEGSRYLNDIGILTAGLQPKLTSVPTIVFNQKYNGDDNSLAQNNFRKALCQYIVKEDQPAECTANGGVGVRSGMIVMMVAAVLYSVCHY